MYSIMYSKTYKPKDVIKALNAYHRLKSFRKASYECGISKSTIQRWSVSLNHIFKRNPKYKKKVQRQLKYPNLIHNIKSIFESDVLKFTTLQVSLKTFYTKPPSISRIHRCLKLSNISRRRFNCTIVCNRNKNNLDDKYKTFFDMLSKFNDKEIICIDETGFTNHNNQQYGYFLKGKQPLEHQVSKREKLSVVAAVHPIDGLFAFQKQQKPFDSKTFLSFIETLVQSVPLDVKVAIMDNVAFHRNKNVIQLLEEHNIKPLFIPPYSPRCNPIEEVFSWMKRFYRRLDPAYGSISTKVNLTLQNVTIYKDNISKHYKHTRDHVTERCLQ